MGFLDNLSNFAGTPEGKQAIAKFAFKTGSALAGARSPETMAGIDEGFARGQEIARQAKVKNFTKKFTSAYMNGTLTPESLQQMEQDSGVTQDDVAKVVQYASLIKNKIDEVATTKFTNAAYDATTKYISSTDNPTMKGLFENVGNLGRYVNIDVAKAIIGKPPNSVLAYDQNGNAQYFKEGDKIPKGFMDAKTWMGMQSIQQRRDASAQKSKDYQARTAASGAGKENAFTQEDALKTYTQAYNDEAALLSKDPNFVLLSPAEQAGLIKQGVNRRMGGAMKFSGLGGQPQAAPTQGGQGQPEAGGQGGQQPGDIDSVVTEARNIGLSNDEILQAKQGTGGDVNLFIKNLQQTATKKKQGGQPPAAPAQNPAAGNQGSFLESLGNSPAALPQGATAAPQANVPTQLTEEDRAFINQKAAELKQASPRLTPQEAAMSAFSILQRQKNQSGQGGFLEQLQNSPAAKALSGIQNSLSVRDLMEESRNAYATQQQQVQQPIDYSSFLMPR